ncbi:MAG: serine/threonine-protein kinase PknK, partial [Bradymonadaceae bacterium]
MITFGPFELLEIIGEGGMGQIWLAQHPKQGVDVAIKIIHADRAFRADQAANQARLFAREAQAMAILNHPTIIGVYDYGLLDAEVEAASNGRLATGSPYLVMDYAGRGSLLDQPHPSAWGELKHVLLQVLEGLAHAHAHDLIHRDLKPGNVLVSERDGREQLKLTDFGIAYIGAPDSFSADIEERVGAAGTPGYMAPEQIRGLWREVGPWTDLYALGCMAYELASGAAPFAEPNPMRILVAHLNEDPAPLETAFPTPPAFGEWVRQLLVKSPKERYRHAADAASALAMLDAGWTAPDEPSSTISACRSDADTGTLSYLFGEPTLLLTTLNPPSGDIPSREGDRGAASGDQVTGRRERAPMPLNWEVRDWPRLVPLPGVGLGLFGKRRVCFVGRREERDVIWNSLAEVRTTRQARAVIVDGPAGCGKSALAEWIGRRAHEVGAASYLNATFSAQGMITGGVGAMLNHLFRAEDLSEDERRGRVMDWIDANDPDDDYALDGAALLRLMDSAGGTRFQPLASLLRCLAAERPIILHLDDALWSHEILDFVQRTVSLPIPVLFIITVRTESLTEQTSAAQAVASLMELTTTTVLQLGPLSATEQSQLIRQLLPLDKELVIHLTDRAGGNPLFAIELLRDWVERGLLTLRHGRFRVSTQASTELPDSLHQVWAERIARIINHYGERRDEVRDAIELGACLGRFIVRQEWDAVCESAGLGVPRNIVDHFARERLIHRDSLKGSFTHEMLRESILRMAEEGGRLAGHHRVCLDVLRGMHGSDDLAVMERCCHHMIGAGRESDALDALVKLARQHSADTNFLEALRCGSTAEAILSRHGVPHNDRRWLETWLALTRCQRNDVELATEYAARIERHARLPDDAEVLAGMEGVRARIAQHL